MTLMDWAKLERGREKAVKARGETDRHPYFYGVAEARYLLRRIFRMVEEEAKKARIDPLAHQALIQIYGAETGRLRIKDVAERLDITPAFASSLLKVLVKRGLVARVPDAKDKRTQWVSIAPKGRLALHRIDEGVQRHVDYFTQQLSADQTEAALSILLFYAGVSLKRPRK